MNQLAKDEQYSHFNSTVLDHAALSNTHSSTNQHDQIALSAMRMTRLLAVLPGGVIVLNGDGVVQQSNAAAIELLETSLNGQSWTTIIDRVFRPQSNDGHDMSLNNGRLVHISTSPLEGEPGQIVLINDVTETRQLQQQVSHLQRLSSMGEMAARLAHQIRTPLSTALLYVAPLLKKNTDPQLTQRFAKRLHNSISHMERLVKDMLAFSRGDMAETAPVLLQDLLASVDQQFRAQSDSEQVHFEIQDETKGAYVYGSKDALTSALNNLVNNARLACKSGGEVIVFADILQDDDTPYIEISVEDDGVGIAEADLDKILTPFFTTRSSGTGLGLAVVNSIAKAHKGELWFESDEGEGSTFCLRLPLYQPAEQFMLTAQKLRSKE
jgi:two-component system, sensor histidine kinase FlrB